MSKYYSKEEVKSILDKNNMYRDKLYCRGFMVTNGITLNLSEYPFYSNWSCEELPVTNCARKFYLYLHKDAHAHYYNDGDKTFFIIGHAYNPYKMKWDEDEILRDLSVAHQDGMDRFWDVESELTGVFCLGYIQADEVIFSTDCAGMQMVYHGTNNGDLYLASHSKLVADLFGYKQTDYIRRLTNTRYWHYWGTYLPGDLSPYAELKRTNPNFYGMYRDGSIEMIRYFPTQKIEEIKSEEEYQAIIKELGRVMSNTMELIAKKWPNKQAAISVTGGRDSLTALSCANRVYDQFRYFSYISNYDESVDAYAARDICKALDLEHDIIEIPKDDALYNDLSLFKMIMECNAGCIGENNENDLRKRLYFVKHPPCEMEIKSWVNELGRAWFWNKFNKKKFPKKPTPMYLRALYKIHFIPRLIKDTDKVMKDYLEHYLGSDKDFKFSWVEQFYWEHGWSGSEGMFLTSEHRVSYDITIPFNNRKYVATMFKVPLEKRKVDRIPIDLIEYEEPRISETRINIHDVSHTNLRAEILKAYLFVFSKIKVLF